MSEYAVGDEVKITGEVKSARHALAKGTTGLVVNEYENSVEIVVAGVGLVSINKAYVKKKVRKIEQLVKAKSLKLSDEIHIPGSGEYVKIASISREDYETREPSISVESVTYNHHEYGYNERVEVRR